jgi:hypothetical protein
LLSNTNGRKMLLLLTMSNVVAGFRYLQVSGPNVMPGKQSFDEAQWNSILQ